MKSKEADLKNATPEELLLRLSRAKLVVLIAEIKRREAKYEEATGKKAPSLKELINENMK